MNLNHDVLNLAKEENYINGNIDDFTDCIDFTKQYQKSCEFGDENLDGENENHISCSESKDISKSDGSLSFDERHQKNFVNTIDEKNIILSENSENPVKKSEKDVAKSDLDADHHPMEPDVSITIGESNLEKTINHVAKGINVNKINEKSLDITHSDSSRKKFSKQKLVKKNYLKLPVNRNIKKKVSLLKLKNGKYVKKKNESFHCHGIQSNIKFKCYKCSYSDFSTISELQTHQRKCISGTLDFQSVNDPSPSFIHSSTSNLRITRKVYLCSACGSYYENWNLFLHMKEMHKRHICLYCLGMFSQPDKLAQHLQAKHNVIEQNLSSSEEFLKLYRGSCYVICVTCEGMFSEQEDFYEHSCVPLQNKDSVPCPLCGLQGAHFPTCRRAFSDRYLEPDSLKSHPALGKKMSNKKKKMKANKKAKKLFKIVNNEHCEMSVVVKKQNPSDDSEVSSDFKLKENSDKSVMSPLKNSSEDLVSAKQYNEKMLQLYRPNKSSEKIISSIQSIEDSINRVVENSRIIEEKEKTNEDEEEADTNFERSEKNLLFNEKVNFSLPIEQYPSKACTDDSVKRDNQITNLMEEQDKPIENSRKEIKNGSKNSSKSCENILLSDSESTDSEKLTIAFDQSSEPSVNSKGKDREEDFGKRELACVRTDDNIATASKENSYIFVSFKDECDDVKALIKEFVKISSWNCVYCSHAKRIALNGKQLALHILAEHRFVVVPENSSEELKEESALNIIQKLKNSLSCLDNSYFNTDTFDSEDKSLWKANDRIYECFHCLFATYVHKELCSHNRKMHQKAVFLCIMCKSNFYTYSELLCHLCPGIYISGQVINPDITYRCFLCNIDPLPSSFRLMVHLRRKHNSCDICFDQSSNQFQLSTHVWKHKLSHMCYRCGIAYRNKPDITKHLFWKHGTESVLCKKCLQKKWPHVYHFCVPPNSFICDECSLSLKSAVALKVHKRIHSADYPYSCIKCEEKFISRKLLGKHLIRHDEEINKPPEEETMTNMSNLQNNQTEEVTSTEVDINSSDGVEKKPEKEKKSKKKKVLNDVFDLPPVNLSESDDSDQEEIELKPKELKTEPLVDEPPLPNGFLNGDIQKEEPSPSEIVDGVWNNFQNYLVAKDMPKSFRPASPFKNMSLSRIKEIMLSDHDYHINPNSSFQDNNPAKLDAEKNSSNNSKKVGLDHDYCNNASKTKANCKSKQKTKHREDLLKSSSSESSSDSDSSCSCGSNCSCSSGSSSSISSNESDSDSREKRKQKKNSKGSKDIKPVEAEPPTEVDISVHDIPIENLIRESDLETDETETDEDFYDYNPAREANRILAEKRTQLLANLNGSDAITSSPSMGAEKPVSPKKKLKVKKNRSQSRTNNTSKGSKKKTGITAAAMTFSKNRSNSFMPEGNGHLHVNVPIEQAHSRLSIDESIKSPGEGDSKRPKRKRVPLKFYGFSSDDESEVTPSSKKREKAEHNTTTPAPSVAVPAAIDASEDTIPTVWNPNSKSSLSWRVEKSEGGTPKVNPIKIKTSQSTKQAPLIQNSSNYDFIQMKKLERNLQMNGNPAAQKGEKLYCFCQCPYDEVSEMIACDAEDCVIEWFHFECVGIMVPPKGSWYCPDCRKKLAAENEFLTPPTNEQNVN